MLKNVASQTALYYAYDFTTGGPKTGDAANILCYVTKDAGSVTAVASNSGVPTEVDATNAPGLYKIALSQTETNADILWLSGKSSTSNIKVIGAPVAVFTRPANFTTFSIDSSGRIDIGKLLGTAWLTPGTAGTPDVNAKLAGGTSLTGRDLGAIAGGGASPALTIVRRNGSTSNVLRVKLRRLDTNQGLTGLAFNTSNLKISTICDNESAATNYTAGGSTIETVSGAIGTYAAPTATKCRFVEIDSSNQPGVYEIHLADARFAVTSAKSLRVGILGAANLQEAEIFVQLENDVTHVAGSAIQQTGGYVKSIESAKPQTWYVDGTNGSDANSGLLRAAAFQTFSAANTAANFGDTIRVLTGTYSGAKTLSAHGVTLIAENGVSFTHSSGATLAVTGNYCTIQGLTTASTDTATGWGINCESTTGTKILGCNVTGKLDGIFAQLTVGLVIDGTTTTATYDGINLVNAVGFQLLNSKFTTTGSFSTVGDIGAVFISKCQGIIQGCELIVAKSANNTAPVAAIRTQLTAVTLAMQGAVTVIDTEMRVTASNASQTGGIYGIFGGTGSTDGLQITVRGGRIALSNASASATYEVDVSQASNGWVRLMGTNCGSARFLGDVLTSDGVPLKKNTAFTAFPFYMERTNGNAATGVTVTAKRSLDGAAFASCANSVTEVANGWYKINLAAADLNATSVALKFTASGAKQRNITIIPQVAT